jgi:hypothetical protein
MCWICALNRLIWLFRYDQIHGIGMLQTNERSQHNLSFNVLIGSRGTCLCFWAIHIADRNLECTRHLEALITRHWTHLFGVDVIVMKSDSSCDFMPVNSSQRWRFQWDQNLGKRQPFSDVSEMMIFKGQWLEWTNWFNVFFANSAQSVSVLHHCSQETTLLL